MTVLAGSCSVRDSHSGVDHREETKFEEDHDRLVFLGCQQEGMSVPEKKVCEDRIKNCYSGRNSQSFICRRNLSDLTLAIKPAELIEVSGSLVRHKENIYLLGQVSNGEQLTIRVLEDSCAKEEVDALCSLPEDSMVTLIGAYYSAEQPSVLGRRVVGSLLALDLFEGGRPTPPPVE